MYITITKKDYPCTGYHTTANSATFSGVEALTLPIAGTVTLCADDGFVLAEQDTNSFARQTYTDGVLTLTNEPEPATPTPTDTTAAQIASLKVQLSVTDYQVTKCSEYSLVGKDAPYDIAALHTARQVIRDQINALEQQLQTV